MRLSGKTIRVDSAFQVCRELNLSNEKRETEGILEAMNHTGLKQGTILTYDQEEEKVFGDKTLSIVPVWKWLVQSVNTL